MSALKGLNFVAVPKQAANDPIQARRNKLITQLEQQRDALKNLLGADPEDGGKQLVDLPKRVKRWWRVDGAGNCFLILRYGNKVISPMPDKGAIAVGDTAKLPEILDAVITAARAGELDAVMAPAKAVDPARGVKRKAA